jgi:hypothetical protein
LRLIVGWPSRARFSRRPGARRVTVGGEVVERAYSTPGCPDRRGAPAPHRSLTPHAGWRPSWRPSTEPSRPATRRTYGEVLTQLLRSPPPSATPLRLLTMRPWPPSCVTGSPTGEPRPARLRGTATSPACADHRRAPQVDQVLPDNFQLHQADRPATGEDLSTAAASSSVHMNARNLPRGVRLVDDRNLPRSARSCR